MFIAQLKLTVCIAEQNRTNPWPTVPDWSLMPECRCRIEAADYQKKCRCWNNFTPAFRHLHLIFQYHITRITPSAPVYGRAGCIHFHSQQCGRAGCTPFLMPECRTVRHPVGSVPEWAKMPIPEPVRHRNATVPDWRDWHTGCRNADAGGIDLDADAQLWQFVSFCPACTNLQKRQ